MEHHSSSAENAQAGANGHDQEAWRRFNAENWDAPIVVTTTTTTTTTQLFESLFASHRSKAQKVHNLANSVIVIDEAQALPTGLLSPILDMVGQLARNCGTTVVLSTATRPAF